MNEMLKNMAHDFEQRWECAEVLFKEVGDSTFLQCLQIEARKTCRMAAKNNIEVAIA